MPQAGVLNVVVAGLSGTFGLTLMKHLVDAGINVTGLTRDASKSLGDLPSSVNIVEADYTSVETLKPALKSGSFDSLIVLIDRAQLQAHIIAIDAAIAVSIPHIIPSSFGWGDSEMLRAIPPAKGKMAMEDYLRAKANDGVVKYTIINTGMVLEYALDYDLFVHLKSGPTPLYNGGDVRVSGTLLDQIVKAVVNSLVKRDQTENKVLFVHSTVLTQNQVLGYARAAHPAKDFPTFAVDTKVLEKETWENYEKGERGIDVMTKFLAVFTFGSGLCDLQHVDNELLGLRMMDEQEVKELVLART